MNNSLCSRLPNFCKDNNSQISSVYDNILLVFLDAVGYRYVNQMGQGEMFQQIQFSNLSNLRITKNIPPSTDFTIMGLINGVYLQYNSLDYLFKTRPNKNEDSLFYQLRRYNLTSSIYSAKIHDWIRMASNYTDYMANSQQFDPLNMELADRKTFQKYSNRNIKHNFEILHFIGFDALGHALDQQNIQLGSLILELFNDKIQNLILNKSTNQLILFLGDHDQSKRGRHYQCSHESRECEGFIYIVHPSKGFNYKTKVIEPIDICATISALFGISSPYEGKGKIVSELFPDDDIRRIVFGYYVRYIEVFGQNEQIRQISIECIEKRMDIDRYIERMDEIFEEKKEEERFEDVNWIILIISLMMLGCLLRLNKERLVYLVGFLIFESYLCYIVGLYKRDSKLIVVCVLMILVELDLLNRAYVWMVLYLIVKMWYLRNNNKKIKTIVVISWLITVMQYQRISFEQRQELVIGQIMIVLVISVVNPRLLGLDNESIGRVIILVAQDSCLILQNHEINSYMGHSLLLLAIESDEQIIYLQHIYKIAMPLLIRQSNGLPYTVDLHSFVILSKDVDMAISLISLLLGRYGLLLISLLLSKQNRVGIVIPYTYYLSIKTLFNLRNNLMQLVLLIAQLGIALLFDK